MMLALHKYVGLLSHEYIKDIAMFRDVRKESRLMVMQLAKYDNEF